MAFSAREPFYLRAWCGQCKNLVQAQAKDGCLTMCLLCPKCLAVCDVLHRGKVRLKGALDGLRLPSPKPSDAGEGKGR